MKQIERTGSKSGESAGLAARLRLAFDAKHSLGCCWQVVGAFVTYIAHVFEKWRNRVEVYRRNNTTGLVRDVINEKCKVFTISNILRSCLFAPRLYII
jgi:hypothetical protein